MIEKQVTFDTVVAHLRKQGCKSMTENRQCRYRGPNDLKCAVGCLIPDDEYTSELEGKYATDRVIVNLLNKLGHDPELSRMLQVVHDNRLEEFWESELADVASRFNLTYTPPVSA